MQLVINVVELFSSVSLYTVIIAWHCMLCFLGCHQLLYLLFVCFSQLDTPSTPGVFVFTMKWGHAHADLSLFV